MELSEKDLEDTIYNAAITDVGRLFLHQRGLAIEGKIFRQVNLGEYGIADLVTVHYLGKKKAIEAGTDRSSLKKTIAVTVYELKKGALGPSTLTQVHRYMRGVQVLVKAAKKEDQPKINFQILIGGVLIGDTVESIDFWDLTTSCPGISAYIYKFDYKGLSFIEIKNNHITDRLPNMSILNSVKFTPRELVSTRNVEEYIHFLEKK
ncbi:hypothetical protein GCM10027299_22080 [Larkinella ripae]